MGQNLNGFGPASVALILEVILRLQVGDGVDLDDCRHSNGWPDEMSEGQDKNEENKHPNAIPDAQAALVEM
jgi:hypothetical protein